MTLGVCSAPLVDVLQWVAHSDKPPSARAPLLYQGHIQLAHILSFVCEQDGRVSGRGRHTLKGLLYQVGEVQHPLGPASMLPTAPRTSGRDRVGLR